MQKLSQSEVWVKQVKSQLVKGHVASSACDTWKILNSTSGSHQVMTCGITRS
jgi:hypothetical protein